MWQATHNSSMLFRQSYANRSISCSVLADSTGILWWQSTPGVMYGTPRSAMPSRLHRSQSPSARCHTCRFTSAQRLEFSSFWYRLSLLIVVYHSYPIGLKSKLSRYFSVSLAGSSARGQVHGSALLLPPYPSPMADAFLLTIHQGSSSGIIGWPPSPLPRGRRR